MFLLHQIYFIWQSSSALARWKSEKVDFEIFDHHQSIDISFEYKKDDKITFSVFQTNDRFKSLL